MKPAPFDYVRPTSLAEACALLAADENARVIAGGQTLVPMMAMRLARPSRLIDILRLPELAGITDEGDAISIGATTNQAAAERSAIVAAKAPLLAKVLPWVGHPPTRNRGTIGGSIANADPAAEIPLVAITLGATIDVSDGGETTRIAADDFFVGAMVTALPPGACLARLRLPVWREARTGTGFHEVNARRSDFAFVAAAAQVAIDEAGICTAAAIGLGGLGGRPIRLAAGAALVGTRLSESDIHDAIADEVAGLEATSDLHASAAYRRRVAAVLAARAVADARDDARGPMR